MKFNYLLTFLLLLLCFNFVSSAPPVTTVQEFPEGYKIVENPHAYLKLNQDYQYNFFVYNASTGLLLDNSTITCNFFLANSSGEVVFSKEADYFADGHWGIDILGGNFSNTGRYAYGVSCQDGQGGSLAGIFEVTHSGEDPSIPKVLSHLILIGFFIITLFSYNHFNEKINYDKWNNKIINRYENKNYIKLVLSSITYNIVKNKFVLYYLLGIPLILLVTDLTNLANIGILSQFMKVISSIYLWLAIIIGLFFAGYAQEWFMDLLDKVRDLDWGVGNNE